MTSQVQANLSALRALMRREHINAYIVPSTDPHSSEYMAAHWCCVRWLSGFRGEAGTAVVTLDTALLWTDSRYYLQADKELAGTGFSLMRESDIDCPSIEQWLSENLSEGDSVGIDPQLATVSRYTQLGKAFAEAGLALKSADLISPLWQEGRPAIPTTRAYPFDVRYSGESATSKLARVRTEMAKKKADALIVCALDEIAWLLNIRALDVDFNPVLISYALLEKDRCTLFVLPEKIDDKTAGYLHEQGVELRGYADIFSGISSLPSDAAVLYDGSQLNRALQEAIPSACRQVDAPSVIKALKSIKNETELAGVRRAMRKDAVALTRFFRWLETEAFQKNEHLTEVDLMDKLHSLRAEQENFVVESFGTIAGYKGNGAIVHYEATRDNCAEVHPEGMLLLDSGGQYLDGTTDITRTVWLGGDIPEQAKLDYTYVLKGHIALADIRWPEGTRGNQLDALAKQYMWQAGITYGHGTGHGVGHFLCCHEGPQNVRTDMNPTPLKVGNICSDEPGIYRTGEWGIRTENLVVVREAPATAAATTNDRFLCWETLTLCYYDTTLIERSLLTEHEREWINRYHEHVYQEVSPLLTPDEAAWLKEKTKAI